MTVLIPRNQTIQCKKTQIFITYADNQPGMLIQIFEGESQMTKDNHCLSKFSLDGIPPSQPQIEVSQDLDVNGILNVSAVEKCTGKNNKFAITNDKGRLRKDDINTLVKADRNKEEDEKMQTKMKPKIS